MLYFPKHTYHRWHKYVSDSGRTFGDRLKENLKTPPPFIDIGILQGIALMWTVFPLWAGKCIVVQGPSRRLCSWESMTHPSTGTWGSTSCPTSQMRSYRTSLPSILDDHPPLLHNWPNPHGTHGSTHILHVGEYGSPNPPLGKFQFCPLFATSVCQTHIGTICGKYTLAKYKIFP